MSVTVNRVEWVMQTFVLAVLLPALTFAQAQREPSDTETGPRGVACNDAAVALRRGTFALSVGRVTLRDGKACVPTGVKTPPCEWGVELTRLERGADASKHLLAVVNADHRAGSGAWDSVFFYACQKGVLMQVHSRRYLYGARISQSAIAELVIRSGEWRASDPVCCPSRERLEYFAWDDTTGRVALRRFEIRDLPQR